MEEDGNKITIKNIVNTKIVWEIANFSSHANQTKAIKSPKFEINGPNGDKNKLFMKIYPNGSNGTQEYAAIFVELGQPETIKVLARIESAIMGSNGVEKHKSGTTKFGERIWIILSATSGFGCQKFIKRNLLMNEENGLLTNGKLTIVCHFDIERLDSPVDNIQIPPGQLSADFANLLEGGILTDFVLISSDNKQFKAHKNVLACRSPVFAAMLLDGMTEAKNNRVKIEDIRGDVLQQMLRFFYTDNTAPNIGAIAKELLAAADKYQIERLKVFCERSLALSLNIGNACDLLVFADFHSAAHLKSEANQFIKSNAEEVIKTDGWKWLATEHSLLVVPLYEGVIKRKRKHANDDA